MARRTITRSQLQKQATINSSKMPQVVEDDGCRYRWVGIGWVNEGEPTGRETLVVEDEELSDG